MTGLRAYFVVPHWLALYHMVAAGYLAVGLGSADPGGALFLTPIHALSVALAGWPSLLIATALLGACALLLGRPADAHRVQARTYAAVCLPVVLSFPLLVGWVAQLPPGGFTWPQGEVDVAGLPRLARQAIAVAMATGAPAYAVWRTLPGDLRRASAGEDPEGLGQRGQRFLMLVGGVGGLLLVAVWAT